MKGVAEEDVVLKLGPCMRFGEFLEHLDSVFAKIISWSDKEPVIGPFSQSHVFYLGDEEKIDQAIKTVWDDLKTELRGRILMPFKDITVVFRQQEAMNIGQCWTAVRLVEDPTVGTVGTVGQEGQPFMVFVYTAKNARVAVPPRLWGFAYKGSKPEDVGEVFRANMSQVLMIHLESASFEPIEEKEIVDESFNNTGNFMRVVAAISHPSNYVVRVSPILTPREERRAKNGKPSPAKRPHFIVVDHEVLSDMNAGKSEGMHASPVPHHRRGHWRRLAERCSKARLMADRVPVRPAYVGKREFSDTKNLYEVLLDFGKRTTGKEGE